MELQHLTRLGKRIGLSVIFFLAIPANLVKAQVVPDGTLESTVETIQELMKIDGGLREGSNLFHSFEEFNIPEGMEASFENAVEIENIFTRVTGDSASTINGTLSAQGGANLFLMNPNGIVFGQDASINLGGSFIATTADSIQFQDGTEFAATSTEDQTPLLTNEIPIGLGFGSNTNSGAIEVNGSGSQVTPSSGSDPTSIELTDTPLGVNQGHTFALIGNGVTLNSATVTGQTELASVSEGAVGLETTSTGFAFNYNAVPQLNDITINQSVIDGSGDTTGSLRFTGENIRFEEGSVALIQNQSEAQGVLSINASESAVLEGVSSDGFVSSSIQTQALGSGEGTPIVITTSQLSFADGARVQAGTYSETTGGRVEVNASERIDLLPNTSADPNRPSGLITGLGTTGFAKGQAGDTIINTSELRVFDGGIISASTTGSGAGGNLTVNANFIELSGINQERGAPSRIASTSFNTGTAGFVDVNAETIILSEGGSINTSSLASGDAGTVSITSEKLFLSNESDVSAASASENGGNLVLNVEELQLDSESQITAEAGDRARGGNININATNITAKKDSAISANASGGNGGNINIDTETLLGLQNSDITANAVEGDGGNINITATSILGFEERPELTPLSDITASSEFGVDGTVNINSPETNAEEDVQVSAKKPEAPLTPLEFVKGCRLPEGILTTRGRGVPESPYPFPFGYLDHDRDVYKLAEETLKRERLRQQREEQKNGISKREAEERRQERELAMLREKQRLLPNRHAHLKYEVTDDREVGPMLLPAPKGKLVEPADGRTDKNAIPAFYSESNELPPISREKRLRQEGNVLVINPNGSKHFVRMFLMSHPSEEMCETTVGLN